MRRSDPKRVTEERQMKIITLPVSDLHPADYNPRKDLAPGDKQYEKLARSIETSATLSPSYGTGPPATS